MYQDCFHIWPDDVSFELKNVVEFLILITIHTVVLLIGINNYIIAIHNAMAPIKKSLCWTYRHLVVRQFSSYLASQSCSWLLY